MFEGVVHRVLAGYLGRYVKNFQKDQLKLSLWNEEVLLENVELIPEAFDYLQLPFAITQGRVGRLSIKISWKKIGWDCPIIIVLEDVFVRISQRDDHEWSMEAVERREYAAKKAQLAAAELAKLSRRVCENQSGKSFISYITAKVLDSIQMSIRNFHVQYNGKQLDSVYFGLKFSSLMIKQNVVGSSGGLMGAGQVNKTVDIEGLELYCSTFEGGTVSNGLNNDVHSLSQSNGGSEGITLHHLLKPFDITASLVVSRAGKPDNGMAQYSIRGEIIDLELSLNEVQLQQLLILSDYVSISRLRERYGRYRPLGHVLSRKQNGWKMLWWHYAQESVLSDVRRKLKKTSWKYLGERLNCRRKYINLYKIKLEVLQQEQAIDEFILWDLEQMEKESDVDDILSYRSAAERELQEDLASSKMRMNGCNSSLENSSSSSRSRGWLNWLSRGMLGAGGTDDSMQFSGVVSDEVVKDIYEATEFRPSVLYSGNSDATDRTFTCAVNLSIGHIVATLQSKYSSQKIADLDFEDTTIECKLWEESTSFICFIKSGKMANPCSGRVVLQIGRSLTEEEDAPTSCRVQVEVSPKREVELSVKVMIQPLEVSYDADVCLKFMEFLAILKSFEFQQTRVLWSLNGFEDVKTRLLSKAEFALSSQKKTSWDVSIFNICINIPATEAISGDCNLVLELGSLLYTSKYDQESIEEQSYFLKQFPSSSSTLTSLKKLQIQDLYNYFAIKLENVELKLEILQPSQTFPILEKFCTSFTFASCIISDESILRQLEVFVVLPALVANFSLPIYKSIVGLVAHLDSLHSTIRALVPKNPYSLNSMSNQPRASSVGFSVTARLKSMSFHIDFAQDGESDTELIFVLEELDICYLHTEVDECLVHSKELKVTSSSSKGESDGCMLFSSGNQFTSRSAHRPDFGFGDSNQDENCNGISRPAEGFFYFHYKCHRSVGSVLHECSVRLNNLNFHCYPLIIGRLIAFYETLVSYDAYSTSDKSVSHFMDGRSPNRIPGFQFQRFGYSNFSQMESSDCASVPLDSYPFITISNSGTLDNLDSSLLHSIPDWRKLFKLRDMELRSSKFSLKKESKPVLASPVTRTSGMDSFPTAESSLHLDIWNVNIHLSGVTVHFHDSSCIIGTITLPVCRSTFIIYEDCMDLLCSAEGLILTSPWWTKNIMDFLWGPSLSSPSSILNIRVRKGHTGSVISSLEVSIGIQHVYCLLPPEYLAIIIGYFSLPEWSPNVSLEPVNENCDFIVTEKRNSIVYKFEILDSNLVLPVGQDDHHFLKIELQQLYSSFILDCFLDDMLKGIPHECVVPIPKIAKEGHCLNVFGRDLSLSVLVRKNDEYGSLMISEDSGCGNFMLIAPLNADVWIRLPCENEPCLSDSTSTCVMSRVANCQIIADDHCTLLGFEAVVDAINQFSSVGDESKWFTSDVLKFFQLKKSMKQTGVQPAPSGMSVTEVRCCTNSLSIIFHQRGKNGTMLEPIANADMQFICAASLINETLVDVDLSFSSFTLHSQLNSVMLAHCADACSASSALHICFSNSIEGQKEFSFSLPSLNIWLHSLDWSSLIDIFNAYSKRTTETVATESSSKSWCKDEADHSEKATLSISQSSLLPQILVTDNVEHADQESIAFFVRSESVGLTIHFPLFDTHAAVSELGTNGVQEQGNRVVHSHATEGKIYKFMAVSMHSKNSELKMVGKCVDFTSAIEKTSGILEIFEEQNISSWPFFQISQVRLRTSMSSNQMDIADVRMEVDIGPIDLRLSHQVFCFWYGVWFDIPESGTSQSSLGNIDVNIQLRKVLLQISDERSCGGPLLEIFMRNSLLHFVITENSIESSLSCDLEGNYKNIHKVLWEPFVEPWKFQMNVISREKKSALLNPSTSIEIYLSSTVPLNLNCTESLIECVFRTAEMINDAWHRRTTIDPSESRRFLNPQYTETLSAGRYAPYILQNLTSLPLVYHVFQGPVNVDEFDASEVEEKNAVEPGASVPIYLIETPEEKMARFKATQSSDRLNEMQSIGVHHFMSVQLEGMSLSSCPISMDLVGVTCFEVDFSKSSNKVEVDKTRDILKYNGNPEMNTVSNTGFPVPVIFDVSVQRYSKLIRLYSTVILSNATSVPLELRFDIPFGLSPQILDPIDPGQEVPLPLHLAEAGRMRSRPLGNSYLWSEVHDLSNILSQEIKIGFLRSFVCYPTHPSSDPFRCCISVQNYSVPLSGKSRKGSSCSTFTKKQSVEFSPHDRKQSKKGFIHQVTLCAPLVLNSYLPDAVSLTIESGGITHAAVLSEERTSFHHVDPSHDLHLELCLKGFKPSILKFPRAETFSPMAKLNGTKLSLIETIIFDLELSNGPLYITVEKVMDAFSGAREIFISVPFLVYNCTGLQLDILEAAAEMEGNHHIIPSCYLIKHELLQDKKQSLSILSSVQDSCTIDPQFDYPGSTSIENRIVFSRKTANPHFGRLMHKPIVLSSCSASLNMHDSAVEKSSSYASFADEPMSIDSVPSETERGKVKACMYSPCANSSVGEFMVRIRRCLPEHVIVREPTSSWSEPFLLVPPSGSSTVLVPQPSPNAAFIISVTSSSLGGPIAGTTRAITFQPRYVISNACSRDLCYKQKGTELYVRLRIGQHSHLHWTDTLRELLVSVRFNEPGWQWSGSFLPDHLGDTLVKMRNHISGSQHMIRVEVQNADVSVRDEKIIGRLNENSGTNLILLSDDDTGFMPYRIDNFSKERIRIYQQKCEAFDATIHPYTSYPYAWDEPCYPHRLTVEVPGERVIGLYALDDLKEHMPVRLKSTFEKPERTLLLSIHAEGAIKVLSIVDSDHHILKDVRDPISSWFQKSKNESGPRSFVDYKEKVSLSISCIGISLISAYPQELLFLCAKDISLTLLQSLDQQKLFFQISSLQIDNQLQTTPYPVILSFNPEYRSNVASQRATMDLANLQGERILLVSSESSCEPVIDVAISTWRKKDISLVSFEYIILRVANFRLELDQEFLLSLLDFFRSVSLRFQSIDLPISGPLYDPLINDMGFTHDRTFKSVKSKDSHLFGFSFFTSSKSQMSSSFLPSVVPIGAPWQQIYVLAGRQKKIYVELIDLAPIKFVFSFSSVPWLIGDGLLTSGESFIHRGLMALADVEGARIHLKQLTISHQMASWESLQDILVRHYTRKLLREMYKVFGSAGVIGNPIGFARSLGHGVKDFLSAPARSIFKSPTGLITGMAQGTTSLLSNTVYALSDATAQFSKAAHKGIVALTFDDQSRMELQQKDAGSYSKGVINEVLKGLTGLLQSPIKEAEKHGLPGVLSGVAFGVAGLVARPTASILEVTGKTAESIRNRSKLYQIRSERFRVRIPRPLSRELPLRPYSLEEAVGTSVLLEVENGKKFKEEVLVMCKSLKQAGKFVIITERLVLIVSCPSLVDLGKPNFRGFPVELEWLVESEIALDSVIHADIAEEVVHIVGSSYDAFLRRNEHQFNKSGGTHWTSSPTRFPLFQTNLELISNKDAEDLLQMLSILERGKGQGSDNGCVIHRSNIKRIEEHS